MPIIGLTKDIQPIAEGLPRLGKLRKGSEKTRNKPGEDLNHFRFTPDEEFIDMAVKDAFTAIYGKKPSVFEDVRLPSNDVEDVFSTWMEWWTAGETLQIRTDGQTVVREYVNHSDGYQDTNRPVKQDELENCKPVGRLNIMLPQLINEIGILGVITVETHSKHDIINIHKYLTMVNNLYGKLTGIPFLFGRVDKTISTPAWGTMKSRQMRTKSLFAMHVMPEYVKTVMLPTIEQNMIAVETRPQIAAGAEQDPISLARKLANENEPALTIVGKEKRRTPLGRKSEMAVDGTGAIQTEPEAEAIHEPQSAYDIKAVRGGFDRPGKAPLRVVTTEDEVFNIYGQSVDRIRDVGWPADEWIKSTSSVEISSPYLNVIAVTMPDYTDDGQKVLSIQSVHTEYRAPDFENSVKTAVGLFELADANDFDLGKYFQDSSLTAAATNEDITTAVEFWMQSNGYVNGEEYDFTAAVTRIEQDAKARIEKAEQGK